MDQAALQTRLELLCSPDPGGSLVPVPGQKPGRAGQGSRAAPSLRAKGDLGLRLPGGEVFGV